MEKQLLNKEMKRLTENLKCVEITGLYVPAVITALVQGLQPTVFQPDLMRKIEKKMENGDNFGLEIVTKKDYSVFYPSVLHKTVLGTEYNFDYICGNPVKTHVVALKNGRTFIDLEYYNHAVGNSVELAKSIVEGIKKDAQTNPILRARESKKSPFLKIFHALFSRERGPRA